VEHLDPVRRLVVVGDGSGLLQDGLTAAEANWVSTDPPREPFRAGVRIRYNGETASALVTPDGPSAFRVAFDEPQRAVTAGQSAVVYDGDVVLGGGVIQEPTPWQKSPDDEYA
jgi:tRNA-specific 2-thiouridylase